MPESAFQTPLSSPWADPCFSKCTVSPSCWVGSSPPIWPVSGGRGSDLAPYPLDGGAAASLRPLLHLWDRSSGRACSARLQGAEGLQGLHVAPREQGQLREAHTQLIPLRLQPGAAAADAEGQSRADAVRATARTAGWAVPASLRGGAAHQARWATSMARNASSRTSASPG